MKLKFNITVEYDDNYITDIIKNHEQYANKTNTTCPKIEDILICEIEDLIEGYANVNNVKTSNYEILDKESSSKYYQ